ncbi:P-loop containing nucleoside triphosphate hydrolase protein [Jimgerdemannia flammicorona]|uniref:P-loop containing nucleoside triphosphate hydrolase protein n=1 Tax=Jimgerdemannia flammicorona TaxID=994334 RepID=A0A432ZZL2_9FUNG|nr:P-loop containing nucleoside triphosphate hydrolase protein [Jimgerdemannia flammicorona]
MQPTTKKYVVDVAMFAMSQVALYYAFKYILNSLDPNKSKRNEAKLKSSKVLGRLGIKDLKLSEYEEIIATEVVHPNEIKVTFDQIGGLDPIIQDLKESVIFPLRYPQLFTSASGLLGAPKGVLLYGPPGCGKTMLAKALARESNATFINLHISTLTDKWFGESNKLVSALFSLARKLQPSIVFIDEIDSFLRERRSNDHEITGMMKAEFMSLWDGLTTGEDTRILVLGATNRPNDIDQAILRRMPKRFAIRLPSETQRRGILEIMLKDINLDPSLDMDDLVRRTAGCSGSDLKEVCRNAAMIPVREYVRSTGLGMEMTPEALEAENVNIRPLRLVDFFAVDTTTTGEANSITAAVDTASRAKDDEEVLEQELVD